MRTVLVRFYGISTIEGYLMPNPLYTYILDIYDLSTHFIDNILKWAWGLFLHTVKWFQVFLYNSHNLTSVMCLHTVCSIWPIDRTLSGSTTLGQSGPGSNDNEEVLHIPQISKARASSLDSLILYPEYLLVVVVESYPSAKMQLVFFLGCKLKE